MLLAPAQLRATRVFVIAALIAIGWPAPAPAATIDPGPDALSLAREIAADSDVVAGAAYTAGPPASGAVAIGRGALAGFPTGDDDGYGLMTTGSAALATTPNTSGSSGVDLGGGSARGNSDYDVTVLRIDVDVPATANCLAGIDFRFLSDEYPEYVGSAYNDAFIAEVDRSTWTTSGSAIFAPGNFAFDPDGNPISINAAGSTSMQTVFAQGTTYDGATPALTAATPITPGRHALYLSIFDQGDRVYDSAVLLDNLRFGRVADVERDCRPGADVARKYYALGDSYSSGFGVSPYDPGTHGDAGPNDCQRSTRAFAPLVAEELGGLELSFHACQGAVTNDFYHPRNSTWGEPAQLDHLDDDAALVTFSIGGNDAKFGPVLAECILGFELLPFNTCHNDDKVTEPVREAFERLDNRASAPADIHPYDALDKDVRARTPHATRVAVGYPHFFPAAGGDRTFLPGGRCEGVKKADQRWMVEKIDELNDIIERNALRNGFLFADPSPRFERHELCGGDDEWIFGLLADGKIHPTAAGQRAIADEVLEVIPRDDRVRFEVGPGETEHYTFFVHPLEALLSIISEWPGSDVVMTLVAPSGKRYTRAAPGAGVYHAAGPTWEHFEVPNPESGAWHVELFGADVDPAGEETKLSIYTEGPPNQRPIARAQIRQVANRLELDGRGSSDPDGDIRSYNWYVSDEQEDRVLVGAQVDLPATGKPVAITLVVTDDKGLTDFATVARAPIDVKPGSSENPIAARSKGKTPVALLSHDALDATAIDASGLRLGRGKAAPAPHGVHPEDVDGDGRTDLMLQFPTPALDVRGSDDRLCMTGTLPDGRTFESCDAIRVVP